LTDYAATLPSSLSCTLPHPPTSLPFPSTTLFRSGPPCADAGKECLLGARNRPRINRHRSEGGPAPSRTGNPKIRPDSGGVSEARLGVDRRAWRHHPSAAEKTGGLLRLAAHALHAGGGSL